MPCWNYMNKNNTDSAGIEQIKNVRCIDAMFVILCTLNRISKNMHENCFRAPEMIPQYCLAHPYCARFLRH